MRGHAPPERWTAGAACEMCLIHKQESRFYCRDCSFAVCDVCKSGEHDGHDVVVMPDEVNACMLRLLGGIKSLEVKGKHVQAGSAAIANVFEDLTGRSPYDVSKGSEEDVGGAAGEAIRSIKEHFARLQQRLADRESALVKKVLDECAAKEIVLEEQLDQLSEHVAHSYSVCFHANQQLEGQSFSTLLQSERAAMASIGRQLALADVLPLDPLTSSHIQFIPTGSNELEKLFEAIEAHGDVMSSGAKTCKDASPGASPPLPPQL